MATEYLNNKVFEGNIVKFQQLKRDKTRYEFILDDLNISKNKPNFNKIDLLTKKQTEYEQIMRDYTAAQNILATSFLLLSENIIRYRKFNLVDVDDAIQEFVMILFDKIDRFNPDKGKAFSYATQILINNYRQLYRSARNYNELKKKYTTHLEEKTKKPCKN